MTIILSIVLAFTFYLILLSIYFIDRSDKNSNNLNGKIFKIQPYLAVTFLVFFIFGVIYSSIYYSQYFLPPPSSVHGKKTVPLYLATLFITGIVFLITQFFLFYFTYRFRYKSNRKAIHFKNNNLIEILWTLIPLASFLLLFIWGQTLWAQLMEVPKEEMMEVEVMGQQFNWWIRYPGKDSKFGMFDYRLINSNGNNMGIDFSDPNSKDDIIPIQLHLPKNKAVRLRLRSRDVIHSVFIPHLRIKMDAVPGMSTSIHFTPDVSTQEMRTKLNDPSFNYEVICAELCGRMHFAMKLIVVVDEQSDYDKWYKEQQSWLSLHPELAKLNR